MYLSYPNWIGKEVAITEKTSEYSPNIIIVLMENTHVKLYRLVKDHATASNTLQIDFSQSCYD